jgi:hypothetical protein
MPNCRQHRYYPTSLNLFTKGFRIFDGSNRVSNLALNLVGRSNPVSIHHRGKLAQYLARQVRPF